MTTPDYGVELGTLVGPYQVRNSSVSLRIVNPAVSEQRLYTMRHSVSSAYAQGCWVTAVKSANHQWLVGGDGVVAGKLPLPWAGPTQVISPRGDGHFDYTFDGHSWYFGSYSRGTGANVIGRIFENGLSFVIGFSDCGHWKPDDPGNPNNDNYQNNIMEFAIMMSGAGKYKWNWSFQTGNGMPPEGSIIKIIGTS